MNLLLAYPAGVAIQVTSTGSSEKIKETIDKYFRHGIYRETGTLIIFIITEKQKTRATESIQAMITEWLNKLNDKNIVFNFDIDTNIRDRSDLIRELIRQNDTVRLGELKKKIAAEFETLVYEASLSPYYEKLKNMYYEPVLNDDNGLTLDKIYIEPSFSVISWAFPDNDQRIVNYIFYPFIPIRKKYSAHEFLTDYLENQNPLRLKGNFRFRLLLGYPGQGKSSFCKRFINDYLRKNEEIKRIKYHPKFVRIPCF